MSRAVRRIWHRCPFGLAICTLVETDEEADEYMDIVFSLCAAYERQGYIEGIKVGARLMIELMEPMGPIELVEPMKPMED